MHSQHPNTKYHKVKPAIPIGASSQNARSLPLVNAEISMPTITPPKNAVHINENGVLLLDLLCVIPVLERHIYDLEATYQTQAKVWMGEVRKANQTQQISMSGSGQDSIYSRVEATFLLNEIKRICLQGQAPQILGIAKLDYLSYNIFRPLEENGAPESKWHPIVSVESMPPRWNILGRSLSSPFGVPACVLTANAAWISFHAQRNFNVLTFKTVRSQSHRAHDHPNWVILEGLDTPAPVGEFPLQVTGDLEAWPQQSKAFSSANSFGISSLEPAGPNGWQQQIVEALRSLRQDQLLIISVVGNHEVCEGEELAQDFVKVSLLAEQAGAPVIELNLSCPNTVDRKTGEVDGRALCENTEDAMEIIRRVRRALDARTKLVIKLPFMSKAQLEKLVVPLAKEGGIDGVSGINTMPAQVRREDGSPTFVGTSFDPDVPRLNAGISGVAVREHGLQFVQWLSDLRQEHDLTFDIIGMGGVMTTYDVLAYLRAGASAVQSATAAAFSPAMGSEVATFLQDVSPSELKR